MDSQIVGKRLREVRKRQGKSVSVAEEVRRIYKVKLDASYLSRMERGKVEIPLRTFFALSHYYKIDPCELLRPEEQTNDTEETAIQKVFRHSDLREIFESLFEHLGKEVFTDLLWRYFIILNKTLDMEDNSASKKPYDAAVRLSRKK